MRTRCAMPCHPRIGPDGTRSTGTYELATSLLDHQHDPDPAVEITSAVLAHRLPPRRPRISARKVKSPISRYAGHPLEERPRTSARISRIDIDLEKPGAPPRPTPSPAARAKIMNPDSRVDSVFTILRAEPDRSFTPAELVQTLEITNVNSFSVQLATWARRGLLGKTARGRYTFPDNCPKTDPLTCADQP